MTDNKNEIIKCPFCFTESERGIIDIETLKTTNQALISTFDEVVRIQEEGRQKRRAAEVELRQIESEMRAKLLDMSKVNVGGMQTSNEINSPKLPY